jgi:hypothetical protein
MPDYEMLTQPLCFCEYMGLRTFASMNASKSDMRYRTVRPIFT